MWFPIDVLTTIPFDSVFEFIGGGGGSGGDGDARGGGGAVRLIKVGKGLKAMKMLRLNKLMRGAALEVYEDIMATSSSARFLLKMLKMLFLMGFIFHWTACLWHLIALNEKSRDNWVDSYFGDDSVEFEDDGDVLLVEDLPLGKRYLAAVYFAVTTMTTVGYGDITPASNSERVFCFFCNDRRRHVLRLPHRQHVVDRRGCRLGVTRVQHPHGTDFFVHAEAQLPTRAPAEGETFLSGPFPGDICT